MENKKDGKTEEDDTASSDVIPEEDYDSWEESERDCGSFSTTRRKRTIVEFKGDVLDQDCNASFPFEEEKLDLQFGETRESKMKKGMGIMKAIGSVLWLLCCPPCPSCIITKAAFRPPKATYTMYTTIGDKASKRRRKLYPTVYRMKILPETLIEMNMIGAPERNSKLDVFYIRTARGNRITCLFGETPFPPPRFTILFAHQNACDLGHLALLHISRLTDRLRCDVIMFDYSGYGQSDGVCSERNLYADVEAVLKHLTNDRHIPPEKIVLMGQSLGTAAVTHLAAVPDCKIAGLILVSPFTSAVRVLNINWSDASFDKFRTASVIENVRCPTLIVHGLDDEVVQIQHGFFLFSQLSNPVEPLWLRETGHNNIDFRPPYWARLQSFLAVDLKSGPLFPNFRRRLVRVLNLAIPELHEQCLDRPPCNKCLRAFRDRIDSDRQVLKGRFQMLTLIVPKSHNTASCSLVAFMCHRYPRSKLDDITLTPPINP